jgi:hypothetical protein
MILLNDSQIDGGTPMTREEHLGWCKQRALEYIDAGDIKNGIVSMASDLRKHPETNSRMAVELGIMMLASGQLRTVAEARKFIEGFN